VFQLWLDDSGRGQPTAFVLAGYFGDTADWQIFSDKWRATLNTEPRLRYLKAYEAFGLRGEFRAWKEVERDRRLMTFLPLLHFAKGIAFVIDQEAFKQIVAQAPGTPFKTPYTFAYNLAFSAMLQVLPDISPFAQVELIFDRGVIEHKQAISAYSQMFRIWPPDVTRLLASPHPRFEDDQQYPPLQAADLLAYCIRVDHDLDPRHERVRRSAVFRHLPEIATAVVSIGENQMQYMRDRVEKRIRRQHVFEATRWQTTVVA
jgi:hypothetical protein